MIDSEKNLVAKTTGLGSTTNPFSTRYTRPGSLAFRFADGSSLEQLVARLNQQGGWGQIIGPHGSGKSTLLATLCDSLKSQWRVARFSLVSQQRRLPANWQPMLHQRDVDLVVVDGMEQLGMWSRKRLIQHCRRQGTGLLVTTHRKLGLPVLYQVQPSLKVTQEIVRELLVGQGDKCPSQADVCQLYQRLGPNVRELLFALYDWYET